MIRPATYRPQLEVLEDRTLLSTFQWTGGSGVNWNDSGNWNLVSGAGTFPNAQGDVAQFTGSYSAAQAVAVNQAITVGEIDFGTAKDVTIGGGNGGCSTTTKPGPTHCTKAAPKMATAIRIKPTH